MNTPQTQSSVGSGEFVRLRSLTFVCVAQAGMALLMGAVGTVDSDTIIPACYFSFSTFVGAWLMRDKPNVKNEPRHGDALTQSQPTKGNK